jgi:hypothetical protein
VKKTFSLWVLFGLLLLGLHIACTPEREQVRVVPNQAPETIITGAPLDSSNAFHRYRVHWFGSDSDGEVVEYRVAVSDSNIAPLLADYGRTTSTDSIIEFVANNEVVLSHAIWVFAVDNEGARDPTPARAFFNAVDVSRPLPSITGAIRTVAGVTEPLDISSGIPDTIPSGQSPPQTDPSIRVTWTAYDPDLGGAIEAFLVKLSTESDFSEIPPDSTGATFSALPSGEYEFQVEAVDNAGARSRNPGDPTQPSAAVKWISNYEPDGYITRMLVNDEEVDFRSGIPTIRDSSRVILVFDGYDQHFDDGRLIEDGNVDFERVIDPETGRVALEVGGFSFRIWRTDIVRGSTRRGPFSVFFPETAVSLPFSNDYEVFIRARDNEGKTDRNPPSVKFHVNFSPVLRQQPGAPPDTLICWPGQGTVIDSSYAINDSLTVTFIADDEETPPRGLSYRAVLDGMFGGIVSPPINAESDLQWRWPFPEAGDHTLIYQVEDPGRRTDELEVVFTVLP